MTDEYWGRFRIEFIPDQEDIGGLAAYSDMDDFMEDDLEGDPDLPFSYLDIDEEQLYMAGDENDTVVIQSLGKLAAFSEEFAEYKKLNIAMKARDFEKTAEVAEHLSGDDGLENTTVPQSEIEEMIGEKEEQASESQDNTFYRRRVDLDHIHDFEEDDMRFS